MRKLASIRIVKDLLPIPKADKIELAIIDGWKVVTQKGLHKVGDKVVYCEIDSFLPIKPIYEFLRPSSYRKDFEGKEGFKLRTIELRGQISQGLILPLRELPVDLSNKEVGEDVSELLEIIKYEPPIPAELGGQVIGAFPSFIRKTDEERIQNYADSYEEFVDDLWLVSEKLDGTSSTFYFNIDKFGVCGRNWEYAESETNTHWKVARALKLEEKLTKLGLNIAIQGELIGEGIQKNLYKLKGQHLYVFNIFDIDNYRYLPQDELITMCYALDLNVVPIISTNFTLPDTIDELLAITDGKSQLNPLQDREGLVFRSINQDRSFKSISNEFLIDEE